MYNLDIFLKVADLFISYGATGVKTSFPKVDPSTGIRYNVFGVWYTDPSGKPKVCTVPMVTWEEITDDIKLKIKELVNN